MDRHEAVRFIGPPLAERPASVNHRVVEPIRL